MPFIGVFIKYDIIFIHLLIFNHLMKKIILILLVSAQASLGAQNYSQIMQVSTSEQKAWEQSEFVPAKSTSKIPTVKILLDKPLQTIEGFGACFNELGWTSLSLLPESERQLIIKEMFQPNTGANFTICRMPVGANDFSRDWYSYNEVDGDFGMEFFSIKNDKETLIPFIKSALSYNSKLKVWASPWSPPSWMKYNKHYACRPSEDNLAEKFKNKLLPYQLGKGEGSNMFIQDARYFEAYGLYFSKFIDAYRAEGINISTIMPQNEFNSCQIFPSCTWTARGLNEFVGKYLGPKMAAKQIEVMFGTMERPNAALVDTLLTDSLSSKYIKGVGFQWAGKNAIGNIHSKYPQLKLYQTEQECGDGKNDWAHTIHAWELMKHYFRNGASAYMYWNISLENGGYSRWGWQQNSLVSVNTTSRTYQYNHEYYLMKHLSHFVLPGAKLLQTEGAEDNLLAFINPDLSIVIVGYNATDTSRTMHFQIGSKIISASFNPLTFKTIALK